MGVILEQSGERFISVREQHIFFVVETNGRADVLEYNHVFGEIK